VEAKVLLKVRLKHVRAILEKALVGETVDEALVGRLEEVRSTLEEVLERSESGVEGAARRGLGEGPASDTPPSAQEEQQ
jgi:hypothetical protein